MNREIKKFETLLDNFIDKNNATFEWKGFIHIPKTIPSKIGKIAFALDLSVNTLKDACEQKADILVCFHAPDELTSEDLAYKKINNILIYKCHLPLNFSPTGIHYQVCKLMKVSSEPETFFLDGNKIQGGVYRIKGKYTIEEIASKLKPLNPVSMKFYNGDRGKKYSKILFS